MRKNELLSPGDAEKAYYVDFEGLADAAPSLLGVLGVADDGEPTFEQFVFDPVLWPAAKAKSDAIGWRVHAMTLDDTIDELRRRSDVSDSRFVCWSSHEIVSIQQHATDVAAGSAITGRFIDAKVSAKRWLRERHPSVQFPRDRRRGRHRLLAYVDFIGGLDVPRGYGYELVGERIRTVRAQLERHGGDYGSLTRVAKGKWTKLLQHNRFDCESTRLVLMRVVTDLAPAGVS